MIETIFRVLIIGVIVTVVLAFIGSISVAFDLSLGGYIDFIFQYINLACYILPIGKLMPILLIIISINVFKIAVSIIKTIWDILPLKG